MPYTEYPERYVAFLDILGFSNIVLSLKENDDRIDRLVFVLNTAKFAEFNLRDDHLLTTTSFSDNILASAELSPDGLGDLLSFCDSAAWTLLAHSYLCRGAIVKGRLHHRDNAVFGHGLIEAYEAERTVADVPRVILTSDVATDLAAAQCENEALSKLSTLVLRAPDGPSYLNAFARIGQKESPFRQLKPASDDIIVTPEEDAEYLDSVRRSYREELLELLKSAVDDPAAYRKVRWLAEEFNRHVAGRGSLVIPFDF